MTSSESEKSSLCGVYLLTKLLFKHLMIGVSTIVGAWLVVLAVVGGVTFIFSLLFVEVVYQYLKYQLDFH